MDNQILMVAFTAVAALSAFATSIFAVAQYLFNKRIHHQLTSKYSPSIHSIDKSHTPYDSFNDIPGYFYYTIDCHCSISTTITNILAFQQASFLIFFKQWREIKIDFHIGYDGHRWREENKPNTIIGDTFVVAIPPKEHFKTERTVKFVVFSNEGNIESEPMKMCALTEQEIKYVSSS